jgi:hypothetical protein
MTAVRVGDPDDHGNSRRHDVANEAIAASRVAA